MGRQFDLNGEVLDGGIMLRMNHLDHHVFAHLKRYSGPVSISTLMMDIEETCGRAFDERAIRFATLRLERLGRLKRHRERPGQAYQYILK